MGRKSAYGGTNAELRAVDLKTIHLGKKPFRAGIKYYAAYQEVNLSPATLDGDLRKLRMFSDLMEELSDKGVIKTSDPRSISEATVMEFIVWMKNEGLQPATQETYVKILGRYLRLFGNDVIGRMRGNPIYRFPKAPRDTPIEALDADELQAVMDATYNLKGWSGWVLRGMLALSFGIGGRPKEVMKALTEDLSLRSQDFFVRHPKGEGSWGHQQWVDIIRKDMLPYLQEYLDERTKVLGANGMDSVFLFVNPGTGQPFTDKSMRYLKQKVEEVSGVRFKLKDMRSTFCSLTINDHMERLNATSEQMRHASPEMTREHYLRINRKKAIRNGIGDTWKETEIH